MLIDSDVTDREITGEFLADSYSVDKLDDDTLPLIYRTMDKYEPKGKELVAKVKRANYDTKYFRGGIIFTQLIFKDDDIFMPTILRN